MHVVPIERAYKDNSNHAKYSLLPKIYLTSFRNKAKKGQNSYLNL